MRLPHLIALLLFLLFAGFTQAQTFKDSLAEGDMIFQTSHSGQSRLIAMATHSQYTHCGLIFKEAGKWQVLEAVEPVKYTPIDEWIKRGDDSKFVVKRLKEKDRVNADVVKKMKQEGSTMLNKHYDLYFNWADNTLYCSELVWKIYKHNTNLEVGTLAKLKDFDLSNADIQAEMKRRYGSKIPYDDKVISPSAIFDSPLLVEVIRK